MKIKYVLIDHEGKEINFIDFHGDSYRVTEVFKDQIEVFGPDGKYIELDIDEVKEQDSNVHKIISGGI